MTKLNIESVQSKFSPKFADDQFCYRTRIFVVKIASRCNLACTYCYMYQHIDQSWQFQPKMMSKETVGKIAERLNEHSKLHDGDIMVVAHGGEPLLYPDLFNFFKTIKDNISSVNVSFSIQTNGTLLSQKILKILDRFEVRVGISIDGNRGRHDSARITHDGKGSYDEVLRGLNLAKKNIPHLLDSILQVIDPCVPPKEMLDVLEGYELLRADLLFPDLNHDSIKTSSIVAGAIGHWLIAVFDEWINRKHSLHIRIFITIIDLLTGGKYGTDQFGAKSSGALMIETDGSYHIYDGLKTAFPGAGITGKNVFNTAIENIETLPLAKAFTDKRSAACTTCLKCDLFNVCGGGNPIHRYSALRGFEAPSVYCEDLILIITHIKNYLLRTHPDFTNAIEQSLVNLPSFS